MKFPLISLVLATALIGSSAAHAYSIDGNLSDWGLTQTGTAADWSNVQSRSHFVEDQTGGLSTYLTPGFGGQAYDAEALYVDWDGSNLYLALITGHNPLEQDGRGTFAPGDFAIDFGANGSYEFGLETTGNHGNTLGGVYANVAWGQGLWGPKNQGPTSVLSGDLVGQAVLGVSTAWSQNIGIHANDKHYFYEAAIPLDVFGGYWREGDLIEVHWTMNCANDSIRADPPISNVPEPGTLALLPLGMLGLIALRYRKSA